MIHREKVFISVLLFFLTVSSVALADKSSVELEAPSEAAKGSEVTVKIHVKHDSNSFLHYTDWVYLKVGGKEVKRWEYSNFNRPEGADFMVEHKVRVEGTTDIEAKAHCNSHGSAGPATRTIKVK